MHATSKITKRVRELAREKFDKDGYCTLSGAEMYDRGCYRMVMVEGNVVYKLARYSHDAQHNRAEWDLYHKSSPSLRALMAKPLAISSCGKVLAVECIPQTARSANRYDEADRFNRRLLDILQAEGYTLDRARLLTSDNHYKNIGVRENGDMCWLDYAADAF